MKNFLLGLGLGVAAGVMMAPASGEETRRQLRSGARKIQQSAAAIPERVSTALNDAEEHASDLLDRMPQELGASIDRVMSKPQAATSSEEEHFGIRHHKGLDLIRGGRPETEPPETAPAERTDQSLVGILNHATRDELISVKGIGLVLAKRIIRHRPYETPQDVLDRGTLTDTQLRQIKRALVKERAA